ncbi:MAG: phosphomannomutase/phosphoglucomutase [Candidatus Azotimanducaceae bacterium]|jgi:phosphomannomutase/phosphoglucomutase|tara:strand:+ start:1266 stop:2675 length:1410 start_codon:yes stop_codon:yes gene_type:complete
MNENAFSPVSLDQIDIDDGIFRAYDIRGIVTSNLTPNMVYWLGRSFATQAMASSNPKAVTGRDGRISSPALEQALIAGLVAGGMEVISIGQVPTPVLYYATHELGTGTGIMITGSHNPPEYNGLKMMIGGVTLAESLIQDLYQNLHNNTLVEGYGSASSEVLNERYIKQALAAAKLSRPLKVVVDCGNGVAGEMAPALLRKLGCEVVPLFCEIDGNFPNHHPDPAEPENLVDLITAVKSEHADVGLAFDGDGDRLGVVTPKGEIIWPDKMMMLFVEDICARVPDSTVIFDVKCSRNLEQVIVQSGGKPLMWKTGHSHMKAKIKETNAAIAGEFSGHICFGERWYGFDDALYSAVRLLELLSATEQNVDEVFAKYPSTFTTPELKILTTETYKFWVMGQLSAHADFGNGRLTLIDGIRVDFEDGWGLVRPSNTSPVLSLRFEADTQAALDRIQDEFQTQLAKIDDSLKFR